MKIAVAGTGYVGLSLAVLLSQYNEVHALDIVPEKVEKINNYQSPIGTTRSSASGRGQGGERELDLHATVDVAEAYTDADYAVIATPTNYDSDRNFFDTSSVEAAIAAVRSVNPDTGSSSSRPSPLATPRACARGSATARSSSAPSSCARAKRSTTTCTPAASWLARRRTTLRPSPRRRSSPACSPGGADPSELERVNADGSGASRSSCWEPPRQRP